MRAGFTSALAGIFVVFLTLQEGLAANPLTTPEQKVCRNLAHCLRIVDEHPIDSFDYAVLAGEFRRFGTKGRDTLLKRIRQGDETARHAADLLALSRNASALVPLRAIAADTNNKGHDLAQRTLDALSLRLSGDKQPSSPNEIQPITLTALNCPNSLNLSLGAQSREMPFFESNVARPDRFGAYRPGAEFRVSQPQTNRGALKSAVSLSQGWLAGYTGGLILYDPVTGAPNLLSDAPILSVQTRIPESRDQGAWVLVADSDGILLVDALEQTVLALLPGQLSRLARTTDNRLLIGTTTGLMIGVSTDGEITSGCGPN